jgi:serpin B
LQDLYASNVTPLVSSDPKQAAQAVNSWVSQATANHIPVIVSEQSLSKNAKAVAVNAVYFNGNWLKPFIQGENRILNFTTDQAESLPVPAMMGTLDVKLSEQDGFQVIEIPFNNPNYALMVLLPNASNAGLQTLQDKLTGNSFLDFLEQGKHTEISLELPKFKILPKASGIKNSLAALGINQIFSQGADFSPLSSSAALTVDDIYHAAGIRVDEAGVEAKSSSAAVVNAKSLKLDAKKISVNRPFVFALIYRPAATALFLGYVNKPEF